MEAQLSESGVFPAQSYAQSFFNKFPTDSRFLQNTVQSFMPTQNIEGKEIEFNFEKLSAANVYMIQETNLHVQVKIVKADGVSLPDTRRYVAPRNNVLHTLFSKVSTYINNVCISTSPEDYCYKAYFTNLLSYSSSAKTTHLQIQGYADDTDNFFDSAKPLENFGFGFRNNWFRKDFIEENPYRPDGAHFSGRLYHELSSCETGLPPKTSVRFVLTQSPDAFVIQSDVNDPEKYQMKIQKIWLTCPIAQLSQSVFDELGYLMSKKEDIKPIIIQYRRIDIRPISVPKDKLDFYSENLFPESDIPCRIIVAFVDAKARIGDYHKNPYFFGRKWVYELTNPGMARPNLEERLSNFEQSINSSLEKKIDDKLNKILSLFEKKLATSSATTSKELPTTVPTTSPASAEPELEPVERESTLAITAPTDPTYANVYIKQIKCLLNSTKIDNLDDTQTEDECVNSYLRMCQTTGILASPNSNGISYAAFRYSKFKCYALTQY